jgi:S-formylglutathione hydrolase FrmB
MSNQIPAIFILPDAYTSTNAPLPVVYLLHGYSSSPRITLDLLDPMIRRAADSGRMIIVLPDGGYNSWYFDSPVQPGRKYETFMASELVRFTDEHYRTTPARWARAITGGSMGGHGAMFIGLRHKDVFGAVGSLSGGVDFRPYPDNWDIKQVLGSRYEFPKRWDEHVVVNNLAGLKPGELTLYVDIGTKDIFLDVNRALHRRLLEMDVPHVYVERPGQHDDAYWKIAVHYQLAFFGNTFKEKALDAGKAAPGS